MTRLEEALDRCQQSLVKAKETGNMRLAMMFEKCIERLKEYMSQPPKEEESDRVEDAFEVAKKIFDGKEEK
jgi:hypothetical protein